MKLICPKCRTQYESGRFCSNCGSELQVLGPGLVCPSCGHIAESGRFCPECGTVLTGTNKKPESKEESFRRRVKSIPNNLRYFRDEDYDLLLEIMDYVGTDRISFDDNDYTDATVDLPDYDRDRSYYEDDEYPAKIVEISIEHRNGERFINFQDPPKVFDKTEWINVKEVMTAVCYVTIPEEFELPTVSSTANGHDFVDLGLPSGLKWATCNMGATLATEVGSRFRQAETVPYYEGMPEHKYYRRVTKTRSKTVEVRNRFFGSHLETVTETYIDFEYAKYGNSPYGSSIDLSDDAARVNWGSSWRIPTEKDILELFNNCTWDRGYCRGVPCLRGTARNGNIILFPMMNWGLDLGLSTIERRLHIFEDVLSPNDRYGEFHEQNFTEGSSLDHACYIRPVIECR